MADSPRPVEKTEKTPHVDEKTPDVDVAVETAADVPPGAILIPSGCKTYGTQSRVPRGVTWEEFRYWADQERADELEDARISRLERGPRTIKSTLKDRFAPGIRKAPQTDSHAADVAETRANLEEEWKTTTRALKTASWGSIFYLITTDILGWSSTPFVFASVGYGPGVAMYVVFGAFSGLSGYLIWKVFLGLSSVQYPMQSFGDTFHRVYGPWSRHFINAAQALQQFLTVAVLVLGQGTTLAQLAQGKDGTGKGLCFLVAMLIIMIIGMLAGFVRSLTHVGWLANSCVWMNIVSFISIMVACSHFGINYQAVIASTRIKAVEAVKVFASTPPDAYQQQSPGFAGEFNGVDQLVYSYGGALLFVAFLSEMRHPMDFWKALLIAEVFICVVYIFFGVFVYSFYGQYAASTINTVIKPWGLQTFNNILGLLTGTISCIMYFNVGFKTVYLEVFQEILNFPEIVTPRGRWCWYALGPLYWILAWVVAAAVPNLNGVSSLVGALLILNFTYTFPALLYVGYRTREDSKLPGEGFDPATGLTTRFDAGWRRYWRGFKVNWHINSFNIFYALGGLVCCGMGAWSAVEGLISMFGPGGTVARPFGCAVPV